MFRLLRLLLRPKARQCRLFSGALGAFLLAVLTFSGLFVAVEADHDCHGAECTTCLGLQNCLEACQLVGSAEAPAVAAAPAVTAATQPLSPRTTRAPAVTLLSLDVRFDE